MAEKAAEEEASKAAAEKEKEREEEKLRREFRKSTVFKATPIPDYGELAHKGVGAVKAPPPLTNPQSPAFASKRRTRSSHLR